MKTKLVEEAYNDYGASLTKWFGGDAARQRAESYVEEGMGQVVRLDQCPPEMLRDAGLDPLYRDSDGMQYTYGVIDY